MIELTVIRLQKHSESSDAAEVRYIYVAACTWLAHYVIAKAFIKVSVIANVFSTTTVPGVKINRTALLTGDSSRVWSRLKASTPNNIS